MDRPIVFSKDYIESMANNIYKSVNCLSSCINIEYLTEEEKGNIDQILELMNALVKTVKSDNMIFYCHKCESYYYTSKSFISILKKYDTTWWSCPLCGYQTHLEEAIEESKRIE